MKLIIFVLLALAISASASITIYSEVEVRGEGHYAHPAFETRSSLYDVFESGLWKNGSIYYKSTGSLTPDTDTLTSEVDAQGEGQYSMSAKGPQAAHKMSFSRLSNLRASNKASVTSNGVDTSMEMEFEGIGTERVLGLGDHDRFTGLDEKGYNGSGRLIRGIHMENEVLPDQGGERYNPVGDILANNTTPIENVVPTLPVENNTAQNTTAQNATGNESLPTDVTIPLDLNSTAADEMEIEIEEESTITEEELLGELFG